jgi:Uma2 family endonuclease
MRLPEALKLTYEDYVVLPEDRRYEVVDGDLFAMPSQTPFHQTVLLRVTLLLDDFVEARHLGVVLHGPVDVLLSRYDVVQPDALYVSAERRSILAEKYVAGPPDLIIEVLLPESENHDRVAKAERYAAFGVSEMWLVNPAAKTIEVLVNIAQSFFREGLYGEADTARSTVLPGLEFSVAPLFDPILVDLATIDMQGPDGRIGIPGMRVPAALKFTYEDYALLPEDRRYEVIDGEVFVTPSPTLRHQLVKMRLVRILEDFVRHGGSGTVVDAPFDVVLSQHDVVQPDILFVSRKREALLGERYADGAPDLVVEVLSPSTETRDRVAKAKRYSSFGVGEMWLVDPAANTVEVFVNSEAGFRRDALYGEMDTVRSILLAGLEFPAAPLFRPIGT